MNSFFVLKLVKYTLGRLQPYHFARDFQLTTPCFEENTQGLRELFVQYYRNPLNFYIQVSVHLDIFTLFVIHSCDGCYAHGMADYNVYIPVMAELHTGLLLLFVLVMYHME